MKSDSDGGRRAKKRIQFSLRTLLVLMFLLGPLSGWYGPLIITQIRDLLVDRSPTNPTITPKPGQIQQRKTLYHEALRLEQIRIAKIQPSLDRIEAHRQVREAHRQTRLEELREAHRRARLEERTTQRGGVRNPLINRNGTFNMRYHLPPSEQ
jgi:hypothetical protein